MKERPTIETIPLVLRSFALADAPQVQQLAGEQEVAATLVPLPHPYEDGMAEHWIGTHQERYEKANCSANNTRMPRLAIGSGNPFGGRDMPLKRHGQCSAMALRWSASIACTPTT